MSFDPWSIIFGAMIGLAAEPIKAAYLRYFEMKLARREIYAELARYLAYMEGALKDNGYDFPDFVNVPAGWANGFFPIPKPSSEILDWYKRERMDILLRVDNRGGIRRVSNQIDSIFSGLRRDSNLVGVPKNILDFVSAESKFLDADLLRSSIESATSVWEDRLAVVFTLLGSVEGGSNK